jgi:putative phosphoribosyl transferase
MGSLRHDVESPSAELVEIASGGVVLHGDLMVPPDASGVVLFAHGSGSRRHSSRNRYVAEVLQQAGLATLLMDLLTSEEEEVDLRTRHLRFDIPMLGDRLVSAIDWLYRREETATLPIGLFGASTGAGAAILAAAARPNHVGAIVSRGGRPDLADEAITRVSVPTLLIVGERDEVVIGLNQWALSLLPGAKEIAIVPGATHLFEEPGALEQVARLAKDWFQRWLAKESADSAELFPT